MPVRWIICPVITEPHPDGGWVRYPRIARLPDAGQEIDPETSLPGPSSFSCVITDGVDWALCFVRYRDSAHLDAGAALDSRFVNLLERDYEDAENLLAMTPANLGWNQGRVNRMANFLQNRGADITGLTRDTPLWQWVSALGKLIKPGWEPRGTWVS
jgi:hypothetical protein